MGSKYEFKAGMNPGPGYYEPTKADEITKTKSQTAIIKPPNEFRLPAETSPAPGEYDGHLKPIGADLKKITMGSKYEFKAGMNPGPGYYEPTKADEITKTKSQTAIIRPPNEFRLPAETSPAPGEYDGHLKPIGADL